MGVSEAQVSTRWNHHSFVLRILRSSCVIPLARIGLTSVRRIDEDAFLNRMEEQKDRLPRYRL